MNFLIFFMSINFKQSTDEQITYFNKKYDNLLKSTTQLSTQERKEMSPEQLREVFIKIQEELKKEGV